MMGDLKALLSPLFLSWASHQVARVSPGGALLASRVVLSYLCATLLHKTPVRVLLNIRIEGRRGNRT